MGRRRITVRVDHDLCVGTGDCARIAPTAFEVNEVEGLATVLDGASTTDRSRLQEAARECPTGAIQISEDQ